MSTNTANVSVIFSTNAESVTDSIKRLRDANEQLASSLDDVQDQANQADDSLDDLAASSNRVGTGMSSLSGSATNAGLSINKLIPAAAALAAGKVALDFAVRGAVATFNTYIATNDQARARTEALTGQIDLLRAQFAEAALGGGNFEEVMTAAEQAISGVSDALVTLTPLINTLTNEYIVKNIQFASDLVTVYNSLIGAFQRLGEAIPILGQVTEAIGQAFYWANPINLTREAVGAIADTISSREDDLVDPIVNMGTAASTTTGILTGLTSEFNNFLSTSNGFNNSFVSDLLDNPNVEAPQSSSSRSSGSSRSSMEMPTQKTAPELTFEDLRRQSEGLKEAARLQAEKLAAGIEVPAGDGGLSVEEKVTAAMKAAVEQRLEIQAAYLAKMKEQREAAYAEQEEAEANRGARLQEILGEGGSAIGDALSSGLTAAMEGKDFGKSVLKSFGDYLTKKGAAMITEGSVDTLVGAVSGNPQQVAAGAAKLGGGAALIAAGKGLGAAGKDGKKASSSGTPSTPPAQAQPVQNVYNVSTNVGMAGDMRAFGREMNEQLAKFRRLGG